MEHELGASNCRERGRDMLNVGRQSPPFGSYEGQKPRNLAVLEMRGFLRTRTLSLRCIPRRLITTLITSTAAARITKARPSFFAISCLRAQASWIMVAAWAC